jgi:glutathione peroxidase
MLRVRAAAATAVISIAITACGDQGGAGTSATAQSEPSSGQVLSGTQRLLNGKPRSMSTYRGEVVLVVNTASECGFTPQFEGLERLYREHRDDGFVILGFPADDVAHQEPRSDGQIAHFCEANFGVSFPMFAKSNVVSEPLNPVFARLNAAAGPPGWNFNKYLLDRHGRVVEHFDVSTEPDDPGLDAAIERLLRS